MPRLQLVGEPHLFRRQRRPDEGHHRGGREHTARGQHRPSPARPCTEGGPGPGDGSQAGPASSRSSANDWWDPLERHPRLLATGAAAEVCSDLEDFRGRRLAILPGREDLQPPFFTRHDLLPSPAVPPARRGRGPAASEPFPAGSRRPRRSPRKRAPPPPEARGPRATRPEACPRLPAARRPASGRGFGLEIPTEAARLVVVRPVTVEQLQLVPEAAARVEPAGAHDGQQPGAKLPAASRRLSCFSSALTRVSCKTSSASAGFRVSRWANLRSAPAWALTRSMNVRWSRTAVLNPVDTPGARGSSPGTGRRTPGNGYNLPLRELPSPPLVSPRSAPEIPEPCSTSSSFSAAPSPPGSSPSPHRARCPRRSRCPRVPRAALRRQPDRRGTSHRRHPVFRRWSR